jgi:hypothetical protein
MRVPETRGGFDRSYNYVFSKISLTLSERLLHTFAYQYLLSRINGDSACP